MFVWSTASSTLGRHEATFRIDKCPRNDSIALGVMPVSKATAAIAGGYGAFRSGAYEFGSEGNLYRPSVVAGRRYDKFGANTVSYREGDVINVVKPLPFLSNTGGCCGPFGRRSTSTDDAFCSQRTARKNATRCS